ncbi:MAG: hypothetical protein PHE41_00195 [Eubacteriales bacterium]|nr:hypothetical protein [Eubacteriales bacterium]
MMIHSGYVSSESYSLINSTGDLVSRHNMHGTPFGIGGSIKIHLSDHFRLGSEGYVSTLSYDNNGSFASVGWGGILADRIWQLDKIAPFIGICIGGGSFKNLTLNSNYGDDYIVESNLSYRKYSFMAVTPFVGMEYAITDKVRLVFKADYLMNVSNFQKDFLRGIRLFAGFSFYRLKD